MRYPRLVFIILAALFAAACSSDFTQTTGPGTLPALTGDVILRFDLQPRVPSFVDELEITGQDNAGTVQFPTVVVPKAPEVLLKDVSILVKKFLIRYRSKGVVVGTAEVAIQVVGGGTVTLTDVPFIPTFTPARIELTPENATIAVGQRQEYHVLAFLPDNTTSFDVSGDARLTVENSGVATVDVDEVNGTLFVAGVLAGQTRVNASYLGLTDFADLTVTGDTPVNPVSSIIVTPTDSFNLVGQTRQMTATLVNSDGTEVDGTNIVLWGSTNVTTGTMNQLGQFNPLAPGTTTITATLNGITGSANATVGQTLITLAQQQPSSLATFSINGNNLTLIGNATLPDLPLTHAIARNNLDAFVGLNSSGIQCLRLQNGFYQNVSLFTHPNVTNVDGIFVHPDGSHIYTWDADARRFCSLLFDGNNLSLSSQVVVNIPGFYAGRISGLTSSNQTFVQILNIGTSRLGQFNVTNLDASPGIYTLNGDFSLPTGPLFLTSATPMNLTDIRAVQCSDTNVFAATAGPPLQLFAFTPTSLGGLTESATPLTLVNSSFPFGLASDPTGRFLPVTYTRSFQELSALLSFQNGVLLSLVDAPVTTQLPFDYAVNQQFLASVFSTINGEQLALLNVSTMAPFSIVPIAPPCSIQISR